MRRILILPHHNLVIGLDPLSARETSELAFDFTQYAADMPVPAQRGAFVWEGQVRCDHRHHSVNYTGRVRTARPRDLVALAGRMH